MAGRTDGLIKNFRAGAQIEPFRIVKFGAADTEVVQVAAGGDPSIGVSVELQALAGERVDVALSDIADVRYGSNVNRGDFLTADAQGRAIFAGPAAGVTVRTIGIAMCNAAVGDIGPMLIDRARITG